MDFINGTEKILYIKVDNTYLPIGCLTENDFSETSKTIGTTTRDNKNGWTTSRPTDQSFNISFSGLVTADLYQTGVVTYNDIRVLKRSRELIDWKIDDGGLYPDFGQGYLTELSDASAIDTLVSFSASIVGYGQPFNEYENVYFGYTERVELDGGTITSKVCLGKFINKLLEN